MSLLDNVTVFEDLVESSSVTCFLLFPEIRLLKGRRADGFLFPDMTKISLSYEHYKVLFVLNFQNEPPFCHLRPEISIDRNKPMS
jgi:hypothetical protein